jgi:hypothetical protein
MFVIKATKCGLFSGLHSQLLWPELCVLRIMLAVMLSVVIGKLDLMKGTENSKLKKLTSVFQGITINSCLSTVSERITINSCLSTVFEGITITSCLSSILGDND